jgi:hypothetical protein
MKLFININILLSKFRIIRNVFDTLLNPLSIGEFGNFPFSKICLIAIILVIALSTSLFAQDTYKYAGEFLNIGAGARALGMGGAFVAVADDGTTTYWSPGGLPSLKSKEISFMYCQQFKSLVQTNFISYVYPKSKWGAFGISWLRLGVDDIPKTGYLDANQNNMQDFDDKNDNGVKDPGEMYLEHPIQVGTFDDIEEGFFLTYGANLSDKFSAGLNVKYIRQLLAQNSSTGIGLDIGGIYEVFKDFKVGFNVQDVTKTKLKWDSASKHEDVIPLSFKFGSAYTKEISALKSLMTVSWSLDTKYGTEMHYGLEWWIANILALRFGLNNGEMSVGTGLRLATFQVDYAFIGHDDLGNTHRISTSVKF